MSAFADNLRRIREAQGLKKSTIAKALGLSLPAYIYYEQGKREPGLTNIKKIADILGVSVNDLFEGINEEAKIQFTSAQEMWHAIDFKIVEEPNGYITIVPPNLFNGNLFPLELPKTEFVLLTNEMKKNIKNPNNALNEFASSAYVITSRQAAIRRKNPHDLIGHPVPIDYVPFL